MGKEMYMRANGIALTTRLNEMEFNKLLIDSYTFVFQIPMKPSNII